VITLLPTKFPDLSKYCPTANRQFARDIFILDNIASVKIPSTGHAVVVPVETIILSNNEILFGVNALAPAALDDDVAVILSIVPLSHLPISVYLVSAPGDHPAVTALVLKLFAAVPLIVVMVVVSPVFVTALFPNCQKISPSK
jgi:hypothetical protein